MQPGFARLLHAFRQTAGGHRMAWAGPAGAGLRDTPWIRPWRLVENIHVFYSPANPPPPTLDGMSVTTEDQRRCRSFSCVTGRRGVPCRRSGTDATAPSSIRVPTA